MEKRILYVILSLLIIILLIRLSLGRKTAVVNPLPEETQIATEQENTIAGYAFQPSSKAAPPPPVITIIRRTAATEGESINPPEKQNKRIEQPQNSLPVTKQKTAKNQPAESEGESSPGITKINKRPTEAEDKEMNSRGIVMF